MSESSEQAGYDTGRNGDFWDDIAQNIGTPGDPDFDRGYQQGVADRLEHGREDDKD